MNRMYVYYLLGVNTVLYEQSLVIRVKYLIELIAATSPLHVFMLQILYVFLILFEGG
jgi:hypothetical protein